MLDAERPLFLCMPEVWEHDLYAGYDLDMVGRDVRLHASINNLLDEVRPSLPTGDAFSGRLAKCNGAYDTVGRRCCLGVTIKFQAERREPMPVAKPYHPDYYGSFVLTLV